MIKDPLHIYIEFSLAQFALKWAFKKECMNMVI